MCVILLENVINLVANNSKFFSGYHLFTIFFKSKVSLRWRRPVIVTAVYNTKGFIKQGLQFCIVILKKSSPKNDSFSFYKYVRLPRQWVRYLVYFFCSAFTSYFIRQYTFFLIL